MLLRFSKSGKRTVSDGFVKKSADSDSVSDSRRRHYKLIYTGRRAQRLSTGGWQMRRRCTFQVIVLASGTDATLPQADALCARQQCRGHSHLGQSPERPGHIGQSAETGRRRTFNTALSDLHPDHSTTSSLRRHLTSSVASSLTHATQCT